MMPGAPQPNGRGDPQRDAPAGPLPMVEVWERCRGAPATRLETPCAEIYSVHGGANPAPVQVVSRLAAHGSHLDQRGMTVPSKDADALPSDDRMLTPSPPGGLPSRWSRCRGALATGLETPCADGIPGHGRHDTSTIGRGLSLWSSQTTDAVPAGPGAGNQAVVEALRVRLLCRRVAWCVGDTTAPVGVSGRCWRVESARGVGRIP